MTKISQYSTDVNITGNDKWIGSDAQNFLITKNFTPNNLANYFNGNNVIDIGSSIRYRYQTLDPGEAREQGTISFETEIGPQVNFSDITTFLIAKNTLKGNTVTQYLDFLVDGKVLISKASNINIFGYYKITSIEPWIPNTNFFVVQVDFLNGNGFIYEDLDYLVSLVDKVQDIPPPVWGSITGDILNQTDLINYISSQITTLTLQQATDAGNTTTNEIEFLSNTYPNSQIIIGANDPDGGYGIFKKNGVGGHETSINAFGVNTPSININSILSGQSASINADDLTDTRQFQLPDASGTIALTSDITIPTLQQVVENGNEYNQTIGDYTYTFNLFKDDGTNGVYQVTAVNNITNATAEFLLSPDGITKQFIDSSGKIQSIGMSEDLFIINYQSSFGTNRIEIPFKTSGSGTAIFELPNNKAAGTYTLATTTDIPAPDLFKTTASGTDTYTATVSGVSAYNDGDAYLVRYTNGNTTGATLNINSLGAKTLYRNNDGPLLGGDIQDGAEMLCVYNSTLNGFQCIGTSPNSLFAYVTNADSVTLTKGMPVYAFGGQGDRMTVKRANNSTDATSAQTVGLVLSNSIGTNQKGLIIMQGLLDGLSILPTSTFSDGDPIYLGATAGSITNVKPYAPNHLVYLGVVTTASNGSAGRMYVRVQNGYELDELHNVDAVNPNNNDGLFYNSTSQLWEHKNVLAVAAERRNANKSTDDKVNYCGIAPADSLESAAVWTITRLTISYAGAVTTATATSVEWDDRETATYT